MWLLYVGRSRKDERQVVTLDARLTFLIWSIVHIFLSSWAMRSLLRLSVQRRDVPLLYLCVRYSTISPVLMGTVAGLQNFIYLVHLLTGTSGHLSIDATSSASLVPIKKTFKSIFCYYEAFPETHKTSIVTIATSNHPRILCSTADIRMISFTIYNFT